MNIKSIPPRKNGKVPNFQTFFQWLLIGYKKSSESLRKHRCLWKLIASYWRQRRTLRSVIWWKLTKSLYTYVYIYIYICVYSIPLVIEPTSWKICSSRRIISSVVKANKLKASPIVLYLHVHTLHGTCICIEIFPRCRKMNIKHLSHTTGLAIWAC